ncbi:hypothetical protein [Pseudomonas putida]|uniref:hypothetical protein n=1 Tax=Pseudomonas putida TaxID=303 RepID=UPI000B3C32ED|nr:hypothetical protein [Pseudomonas putida]OUS86804.1 hypothetical protein CBP05_04055 [Pseudomonas putida]OUS90975.1 hypothetical protein CBP06_02950 [Pseudomonas putida]
MIITIAFSVKNYVEVMESWPIKIDDIIFTLERKDNIVQTVCISFPNVAIENAPQILRPAKKSGTPQINMRGNEFVKTALKKVLNWQAVVISQQLFDLEFDSYEMRFVAETPLEQSQIHIKSFRSIANDAMNRCCDFEQIGRSFCVGEIDEFRIESTSHFREGRIAYEAGRYVDSYNQMFLFLETRYCDGKTKTAQQVDLLSKNMIFCSNLEQSILEINDKKITESEHLKNLFKKSTTLKEKITIIILLRGKLRHHSLKSSQRWNPNQQDEYEAPARFLSAVVGSIVLTESLNDIYAPKTLEKFRKISTDTGYESNIKVVTNRLERAPALSLEMSYPVTVVSSNLCKATVVNALSACESGGQLADTVRLEAEDMRTGLELFTLELGVWAYTKSRSIEHFAENTLIRCQLEHFQSKTCVKHEFSMQPSNKKIDILAAWHLLKLCLDWIEEKDPTTRILSLKLFLEGQSTAFLRYKVGAQVKN